MVEAIAGQTHWRNVRMRRSRVRSPLQGRLFSSEILANIKIHAKFYSAKSQVRDKIAKIYSVKFKFQ